MENEYPIYEIMAALSRQVQGTPIKDLPYDSVRRARERLLEDQANGFDYSRFDLETVLGKPNPESTLPQIEREIREYFIKSVGDPQERAKFLKDTEEARIRERREMYKRAGEYLSSD